MKVQVKALPSNSLSLFPKDTLQEPVNHPVRLVNETVDKAEHRSYHRPAQRRRHDKLPSLEAHQVLFYTYLSNIYSSQRIEKALHENIHFYVAFWTQQPRLPHEQVLPESLGAYHRSMHLFGNEPDLSMASNKF